MATEGSRFFFSYAREDSEIVLRLARELRKAGGNVWLDQLDIRGGSRWDDAVQAALESCQGLVAVLSPSSVASQNFLDEVSYALEEQKQVIPILYRECAIPFRLRRVQYVNLAINYDDGFAELLRSIGLERPTESVAPPVTPALNEARPPAILTVPEEKGPDAPVVAREDVKPRAEPDTRREAQEAPHEVIASVDTELPVSRAQRAYQEIGPHGMGSLVGVTGGLIVGLLSCWLLGHEHEPWGPSVFGSSFLCAAAGFAAGTSRRRIIFILFAAFVGGYISLRFDGLFDALTIGAPVGAFLGMIVIVLRSIPRMIRKGFNKLV
jgi:hypothetical protein